MTTPTSAAEVRAMLAEIIMLGNTGNHASGRIAADILAHPVLGPRLLGQQGGDLWPKCGRDTGCQKPAACEFPACMKKRATDPSPVQAGSAAPADDARLAAVQAERDQAVAEVERLREALKPSGETKSAYIGEFHFPVRILDEDGEEAYVKTPVPWTTIKEIMAAIRARAALASSTSVGTGEAS